VFGAEVTEGLSEFTPRGKQADVVGVADDHRPVGLRSALVRYSGSPAALNASPHFALRL
jgi:hypothetical protein